MTDEMRLHNIPDEFSKKLEIELGATNWQIPETDIFDEPTRCLKLNLEWSPIILSLVSLLTEVGSWKDAVDETYPPIIAIRRFLQGIECEGAMDCGDVADCVESELGTNQALQDAIYEVVNNSGFGNPNHVNATQTTVYDVNPAGALAEPVKELENCNLDVLWGGIRNGIVAYLDDEARSLLENLAPIADTAERLTIFLDAVPVLGDIAEGLAFQITEIVPDLLALFSAYSSISNLNEIACHLFDLVCSECRYPTFEEVFNYYKSEAFPAMPDLSVATLEAVSEFLLEVLVTPAETTYHTIVLWELFILNLNATFNGNHGTGAITNFAELGEDSASNNWQDLCDGCGEDYQIYTWDYTSQQYESKVGVGFTGLMGGTYVPSKGWRADKLNTTSYKMTIVQPVDPTWKLRSVSYETSIPKADVVVFEVSLRTIAGSATGSTGLNMTTDTSLDPNVRCRQGLAELTNFMEIAVSLRTDIPPASAPFYLERLTAVFSRGFAPSGARPTSDASACNQE